MSRHVADENPQIIALDTYEPQRPYMDEHNKELSWRSEHRRTGLQIHLMPVPVPKSGRNSSGFKPRLEWVNGRWPRISYESDGLSVSIQYTVQQGVISQQFLIKNPSKKDQKIPYALQAEGSTVTTLHIEDNVWEMTDDFDWTASKPQIVRDLNGFYILGENKSVMHQDGTRTKYSGNSEAIMAVFHNGVRLGAENVRLIPIEDEAPVAQRKPSENLLLNQNFPSVLCIPPHGIEEVVVQYILRSHIDNELPYLDYFDVGTFLRNEQYCVWSFKEESVFNNIFRRQLEHILCLCLVKVVPSSNSGPRIPFDTTLASGSTPVGDL